jgi:hypothetical protein
MSAPDIPTVALRGGAALWWRRGWSRFRRNPLSLIGLALTSVFLMAAILAPVIAPHAPFDLIGTRLLPPSRQFLFGTDNLGRDLFSGVLYGARTSIEVGLISTAISLVLVCWSAPSPAITADGSTIWRCVRPSSFRCCRASSWRWSSSRSSAPRSGAPSPSSACSPGPRSRG